MKHRVSALVIIAVALVALAGVWPAGAQTPPGAEHTGDLPKSSRRTAFGVPPSSQRSSFDLVAEYTFNVSADGAADWTLGRDGRAGKRLSFLLPRNSIKTYAEPLQVYEKTAERDTSRPMIWLNRSGESEPFTYTLVVVGNQQILFGLQLERAYALGDIFPNLPTEDEIEESRNQGFCPRDLGFADSRVPVSNLAAGDAISATLRGELVAGNGAFFSIPIDAIDFQPDAEMARLCYTNPGFVLLYPSYGGWQDHRILMVLKNGIAGPPGDGWSILCSSWQSGNWWTRFVSALYGC